MFKVGFSVFMEISMKRLFICKSVPSVRCASLAATSRTYSQLGLLQSCPPSLLFVSIRRIWGKAETKKPKNSFAMSYLINTFGFPPASALSVSKHLRFTTSDSPDSVIKFLEKHGFSKSQITRVVRVNPTVLNYKSPWDTLSPKFEFFYSKGWSHSELAKMLSSYPLILTGNLKNTFVPCFAFLKSHLQIDDDVAFAIKRFPRVLYRRLQALVEPKTTLLLQSGVPQSKVSYMLKRYPHALMKNQHRFKEIVEEVKQMGISPLRLVFVMAIHVRASMSKSTWESKMNFYKKWGLSEKEILSAFAKGPMFLAISEDNAIATIEFFVKDMGWEASQILQFPQVVGFSLKKRIIPRYSVIKVLWSKGLIDKAISSRSVLNPSDVLFVQRFVKPYEGEVPHLMKLYQENVNLVRGETVEVAG